MYTFKIEEKRMELEVEFDKLIDLISIFEENPNGISKRKALIKIEEVTKRLNNLSNEIKNLIVKGDIE